MNYEWAIGSLQLTVSRVRGFWWEGNRSIFLNDPEKVGNIFISCNRVFGVESCG